MNGSIALHFNTSQRNCNNMKTNIKQWPSSVTFPISAQKLIPMSPSKNGRRLSQPKNWSMGVEPCQRLYITRFNPDISKHGSFTHQRLLSSLGISVWCVKRFVKEITIWHLNNISQYLADLTKCFFDQLVLKCSLVHQVLRCLPDVQSLFCNNFTTNHTTFNSNNGSL